MNALQDGNPPTPALIRAIVAFEQDFNPNFENPTHVEVGLSAPNGANRLFIFTGSARVGIRPTNDNELQERLVQIALDLDISPPLTQLLDSACYAGLAAYSNTEASNNTTYAINSVELMVLSVFDPHAGMMRSLPTLQLDVFMEGTAGNTTILNISYQATLQVLVGFSLQVSVDVPGIPPSFAPTATIRDGDNWLGLITVPSPAPTDLQVSLTSLNPGVAAAPPPAQQPITIPAGQTSATFTGPNTQLVNAEVDVPIVANLGPLTSTAILRVVPR
jgi:hypothetical protein